jgi:TPR repeat protein
MSDPETTQPAKPEPSPDDTVRLSAGMPGDPHGTQPLNRDENVNADGTLKLTLADPAQRYEPTQEKALKLYEPPVQQQVPEPAGETQPLALRPDATPRLPTGAPVDPGSTQKLTRSRADDPPILLLKVDQPAGATGRTQDAPRAMEGPRPFGWKLPLGIGALVLVGTAAYFVLSGRTALPHPASRGAEPVTRAPDPAEVVPPAARDYLEQARAGDVYAMRILGAYYYYGLNVPQDREKGLYWYRKAAEKGSDAARLELSKIEGRR